MTRQLRTTAQNINERIAARVVEKTRRAYLVTPYRDKTAAVLVTFSNPTSGVRGAVVRALISPGLPGPNATTQAPNLDAGYPLTVVVRHGQVEVVGF